MPRTPAAASSQPAEARAFRPGVVLGTAMRRNTPSPNSVMTPAYISHRNATAESEGCGVLATAALGAAAPVEDTPTPKAKEPLAMWPSTWERVCQATV